MTPIILSLPLLLAQPMADAEESAPAPVEAGAPEDQRPILQPPGTETAPDDVDVESIEGRRRPGFNAPLPERATQDNMGAVRAPPPEAFPTDQISIPDRWRLIETLGVVKERWFDPYHQNTYKGDRPINPDKVPWLPITGDDWFFSANLISDTVLEPRTFPIPVGVQTTARPHSLDVFGKDASFVFSQTVIANVGLTKGQTAFKPPVVEYRLALAFNYNYVDVPERRVLFVEPSKPTHRSDHFLGVQEAFIDYHLRNVSDRYDFDSIRVGIQPFQADFRGFLFNDSQLGIRLFGNRDNNRFQYNLAAFWRLEKDTNSGLNAVLQTPRDDFVFFANLYRQDFLIPSLTSQITVVYNRNREAGDIHVDDNGFPVRPALLGNLRGREYDVVYLGYNADGHVGRVNVTASAYAALGEDRNSIFTGEKADIRAFFGAAELSYDKDWMRFRLSALYASGDHDPYDGKETGFDAIFENPIFAGADTSYWIRQTIPFAGGGRVIGVNGRNGILNSLRSSKEQGQSNFNNPGTMLLGAGADFDLTPELRVSANANHLWFENTATLQTLRNEGSIPKDIGWDLSAAAIWRPKATQNIVFRLSAAALVPGGGFRDLFDNYEGHRNYYSVLANVIVSY
ncbi:alginate export family protein [Novosphingobium mangrovi (ex Huang et al. 2023)]|uniref:Alginate export family protein n=1 Tax=Novosphingobium mangrovi (ex Huang et al. 2023) TaxID=2976432 RepID=A0ABT2I9M5_9SPHN|nr:alginate export family protein [Novosphingobium mangrovi (ex Huang et al. 2023)]MCT2401537.1 alginate export family protein [Novosphingobium mangrovi (ex Huang et al. 2023)]